MQLVLKNNGSIEQFINWLKGFKDINPTLLVEIDLVQQKFVAKGFPDSRSIVKYSEISFENAGYTIETLVDNDGESMLTAKGKLIAKYAEDFTDDNRIKAGLYSILGKVIDTAGMYDKVDHTMTITFDMSKNVKYVQAPAPIQQWQAEKMILSSKTLTVTVNCSQLSEFFRFLTDDLMLNTVCAMPDAVNFTVTPETIANLNRISQFFVSERSRATIKFYIKKDNDANALYAYDDTDKSYDYLLGYMEGETPDSISVDDITTFILRENFINATKALNETLLIALSPTDSSRVLVESGTSRIVIAAHQNR